ncbi:hypothetical protein B0H16DRAFT_1711211 [Mycena metata]|uniref:Uncharacterized protein n=1 Tax=Mycena metata TaxID=1033252 RepID=A0AAD7NYD6_9AGAR|nr:hypothetical protein B0H16DRAFT_1711211 [Mycena metata]
MARNLAASGSKNGGTTRKHIRRTEGKKPGKISWIHGTKATFFESRAVDWAAAQKGGSFQVGQFYDNISSLYLQKYGYNMKDEDDLAEDVPDPTDPQARDADAATLTQEEADRRSKIYKELRTRIGQWYRLHYGGGVEQAQHNLFHDMLSAGANMGVPRPAKMQTWQYYSRLHYDKRVKARFEERFKTKVQRAKDLGKEPPWEVGIRGEVTRQAWAEELDDFKAVVTAAQEKEHQQMIRAWEMGFEMNVAIMLCGPVGHLGGAVEVRSVHAGTSGGVNPQKWYNWDPVGYQNAERSMVRFSEETFNVEERRRRIVSATSGTSDPVASGSRAQEGASSARPGSPRDEQHRGDASPAPGDPPSGESPAAPPPAQQDSAALRDSVPPPPQDSPAPRDSAPPRDSPTPRDSPAPEHKAWKRNDMREWPEELRRAHSAFAMGAKWPVEWAGLVSKFLQTEAGVWEEVARVEEGNGRLRPSLLLIFVPLCYLLDLELRV